MAYYTIGQLAKRIGVPITTIRYYERLGLLLPERQASSNYRRYNHRSTEKLKLILEARRMGLSLGDIKALNGALRGRALHILQTRLHEVEKQISKLSRSRSMLVAALKRLRRGGNGGLAAIVPGK